MDILKKTQSNIGLCKIDKNGTFFQDKQLDGSQVIIFPSGTSKNYTLRSVLFFLIHTDIPLKEYVLLCKNNNVSPISYVDKASILGDIEKYETSTVKGFFTFPIYSSGKTYNISVLKQKNIIIVPKCFTSKIHIGNVKELLADGMFLSSPCNPLADDTINFMINGTQFIVTDNPHSIDDWERVKAVFVENSESKELLKIIKKCPANVILLSLKNENFKSLKVEISGKTVKNHQELIETLLGDN